MIRKTSGGYKVLSEKGKNLGGPYKTEPRQKSVYAKWSTSSMTKDKCEPVHPRKQRGRCDELSTSPLSFYQSYCCGGAGGAKRGLPFGPALTIV
jgi:hypothetical protein